MTLETHSSNMMNNLIMDFARPSQLPALIHIHHRVIHAVHIQIPALHHRGDLRNVCVGLYAQSVLALVCFLRVVSVDPVCVRPVGVLLCETAYGGGVVSCAEVVGAGLSVVVLTAVPERVGVVRIRCGLVAERVIGVGLVFTIPYLSPSAWVSGTHCSQ